MTTQTAEDWIITFAGAPAVRSLFKPATQIAPSTARFVRRQGDPYIEMAFRSDANAVNAAPREALREFVGLSRDGAAGWLTGEPDRLLAFVRGFGPLGLCRAHQAPLTHTVSFARRGAASCPPQIRRGAGRTVLNEPVAAWLRWSRVAKACLNLTAHSDNSAELKIVQQLFPRAASVLDGVDMWLSCCFFQVALARGPVTRLGDLIPIPPLFGQLGIQLALEVVRAGGVAFCANCGDVCEPRVKPQTRRRAWCRKEECRRAMWREAQRRSRANREPKGEPGNGTQTQRG